MSLEYVLTVVGMGVVTYIPRWFPLFFLSRRRLPHWLVEWLDFIPVSILSALVLPGLVTGGEPRHVVFFQPELIVAVPTLLCAWKTRSLAGTVLCGMSLYWLVGKVML